MNVKKISFIGYNHQNKNKIFDNSPDNPVNRDDATYPFFLLKKKLKEKEIDISTFDINKPEASDELLFYDFPEDERLLLRGKKKYLIISESEVIKPKNWLVKNHEYFEKIFTWNDDFIDNKKYFKLNFSNKIFSTPPSIEKKEKFCCLIAGAKTSNHEKNLYSKRIDTIRWFEKNHLSEFDLYGLGWDLYEFKGPIFIRAFNRIRILRKFFSPRFPSYKGKVKSKFETLKKYKFSICYENAQMIPGYITEKLFDCLFSGCIPVYWGAPNILDFVPENCFIDRRKYKSHEELFEYLKSLSNESILEYQKNIYSFLNGEKIKPYSGEYFADTLVKHLI